MTRLVAACVVLAAASLLLVPAEPANDPWAWIVWGREVVHLDLDTTLGASWKPLPVLFTAPFSLLGDAADELWIIVARAGGLLGLALAFRLAYRLALADRPATRTERAIAAGAGVLASGCLLLLVEQTMLGGSAGLGYVRYLADGRSEGLLVALVLLSVDRALNRRYGQALAAGALAALMRPEIWPFLAAYAVWASLREPRLRLPAAGALAAVAALWVLPDWWGSGDLLASGSAAAESARKSQTAGDPVLVLKRINGLLIGPVEYAALVAVGFAVKRREIVTLVLGASALLWVLGAALATEFGYPGLARFLVPAAAIVFVLGGVGAARIVQALGAGRPAMAVGLLLVAGASPFAWRAVDRLVEVPDSVEERSDSREELELALARSGGAEAVRACGPTSVDVLVRAERSDPTQSRTGQPRNEMAWLLEEHIDEIRRRVPSGRQPGVLFQRGRVLAVRLTPPRGRRVASAGGWEVFAFGDCRLGSPGR